MDLCLSGMLPVQNITPYTSMEVGVVLAGQRMKTKISDYFYNTFLNQNRDIIA